MFLCPDLVNICHKNTFDPYFILRSVDAGNDYSKSTLIMTVIKQEKLVFILVILYIRKHLHVFTKLFTGARASKNLQFWVSNSQNNRNAQPQHEPSLTMCIPLHMCKCISVYTCAFFCKLLLCSFIQ